MLAGDDTSAWSMPRMRLGGVCSASPAQRQHSAASRRKGGAARDALRGDVQDGDAVVIFNFRADRVVELSKALEYEDFSAFDRCALAVSWGSLAHAARAHAGLALLITGAASPSPVGLCAAAIRGCASKRPRFCRQTQPHEVPSIVS